MATDAPVKTERQTKESAPRETPPAAAPEPQTPAQGATATQANIDYDVNVPYEALKLPDDFPRQFITTDLGKPFITYPGLLWLLHHQSKGHFQIEASLMQTPSTANGMSAIAQARVIILDEKGAVIRETSDVGDANEGNTSRAVGRHFVRMAMTRAKARAMRDIVNVGIAAVEELGERDSAPTRQYSGQRDGQRDGGYRRDNQQQQQNQRNRPQQDRPQQDRPQQQNQNQRNRPQPAADASKGADDSIEINGRMWSRTRLLERYHHWEKVLTDNGYTVTMLPDFAPLQQIADHCRVLKQTHEEDEGPSE